MSDFLSRIKEEGKVLSVANPTIKGKDVEEYLQALKGGSEAKATSLGDLKFVSKNGASQFTFSKDFFASIPDIQEKGTGFTEIYLNKCIYLYFCSVDGANDLDLKPKYMYNKKGANKLPTFKADTLGALVQRLCLDEAGEGTYQLSLIKNEDVANLFQITLLGGKECTNKTECMNMENSNEDDIVMEQAPARISVITEESFIRG